MGISHPGEQGRRATLLDWSIPYKPKSMYAGEHGCGAIYASGLSYSIPEEPVPAAYEEYIINHRAKFKLHL